jgi:hypothetical protein
MRKNSNLKTDNFAKNSMVLNIENQQIKKELYRRRKAANVKDKGCFQSKVFRINNT